MSIAPVTLSEQRESEMREKNPHGTASTAAGETQKPAKVVEDENSEKTSDRRGSAVWGSEGSGETVQDPRRKESS